MDATEVAIDYPSRREQMRQLLVVMESDRYELLRDMVEALYAAAMAEKAK